MATRRLFSREFKLEAVKLVVERGVSVAQVAKDLDVHESVLRKWGREAKADLLGRAWHGVPAGATCWRAAGSGRECFKR